MQQQTQVHLFYTQNICARDMWCACVCVIVCTTCQDSPEWKKAKAPCGRNRFGRNLSCHPIWQLGRDEVSRLARIRVEDAGLLWGALEQLLIWDLTSARVGVCWSYSIPTNVLGNPKHIQRFPVMSGFHWAATTMEQGSPMRDIQLNTEFLLQNRSTSAGLLKRFMFKRH